MTLNELIERLQALPEDVRERPLMNRPDGTDWYPGAVSGVEVSRMVAFPEGDCMVLDEDLTDEENLKEAEDEYLSPARIERRAVLMFDC